MPLLNWLKFKTLTIPNAGKNVEKSVNKWGNKRLSESAQTTYHPDQSLYRLELQVSEDNGMGLEAILEDIMLRTFQNW